MNNPENLPPSSWGLVSSLAELHEWELDNLPLLALGAGSGDGASTTGLTYTNDNNSSDWLGSQTGFTALGITGVNSNNLAGIKKAIDTADAANNGAAIDTVQELQAIVSMYRINDYADNNNTNPPCFSDSDTLPA